jgi:hypothetical protein
LSNFEKLCGELDAKITAFERTVYGADALRKSAIAQAGDIAADLNTLAVATICKSLDKLAALHERMDALENADALAKAACS